MQESGDNAAGNRKAEEDPCIDWMSKAKGLVLDLESEATVKLEDERVRS